MKNEREDNENWIAYELSEISLGDQRLNWRLLDSGAKLAAKPSASINQACNDWADTKATYRLFANPKTTMAQILAPHQQRSKERMSGHKRILAIQDSSYLDYSHHPGKRGMGAIGTSQQNLSGLVMHSVLSVSVQGLAVGLVHQRIWARAEKLKQMSSGEGHKIPLSEKESHKWLLALRETVKWQPAGTQLVTVGDSEADLFDLFDYARKLETDLLIRAGQNRSVCEPEVGLLWEVVAKQPSAGHLKVQVSQRTEQPAREATVAAHYTSLVLRPPQHLRTQLKPLSLDAVLAQEIAPPTAVEPLCWLLLTTVPVASFDAAIDRIHWDCHRWQLEIFHKILKSGCRIEQAQLASEKRLMPLIALFSIIAWRLFWITWLARTDPDAPATTILAHHELAALYTFLHKQPIPDSLAPTIHQAIRWIAQLGGFLNRKRDGEPGVTVIWRGWQRLTDISTAYLPFHPP